MKSAVLAVMVVLAFIYACSDTEMYPVATQGNSSATGQSHLGPDAGPHDAPTIVLGDGRGFDGLPTEFDAGAPTDVGFPAHDAF